MASEKKPGETKKPTKKAVSKKAAPEKQPFAELSEPKAKTKALAAPDKQDGRDPAAPQQAPWQLLVAFMLVLAFLVGYGLLT